MNRLNNRASAAVILSALSLLGAAFASRAAEVNDQRPALRAELLTAATATAERIARARRDGSNGIVLELRGSTESEKAQQRTAAAAIGQAGLRLFYWIEVGRNEELARAHPEWMASLQGHSQWRRLHPQLPEPKPGEVVKNFPWVPILYKEAFDAHVARVAGLLGGLPIAEGILVNDLQGAPSACGCGNTLCRWTADYGSIRTATDYGPTAAADFVRAVSRIAPDSQVIPVWVTECEEHDGEQDGACAGVGCFAGICWRAYCRQLTPLAREAQTVGVLLPVRSFGRDTKHYDKPAGWITHALGTFQSMPPLRGGTPVPASRLLAVLQGWNVTPDYLQAQKERAAEAGTAGFVVATFEIDQTWQPRIITAAGR